MAEEKAIRCSCGCGTLANNTMLGLAADLKGLPFNTYCVGFNIREFVNRIRANRAKLAQPTGSVSEFERVGDTIPAPELERQTGSLSQRRPLACDRCGAPRVRNGLCAECDDLLDAEFGKRPEPEPAKCQDCSAPATNDGRCVYCRHLIFGEPTGDNSHYEPRNLAARARMAVMDRGERPRVTAETRQNAVGHPVNWPSNEGEE